MAAHEENGSLAIKRQKENTLVIENHLSCKAMKMDSALLFGKRPWTTLKDILKMRQQPHLSSKGLPDALTWGEIPIFE